MKRELKLYASGRRVKKLDLQMLWEDAGTVRGAQLRWRALALPLLEADTQGTAGSEPPSVSVAKMEGATVVGGGRRGGAWEGLDKDEMRWHWLLLCQRQMSWEDTGAVRGAQLKWRVPAQEELRSGGRGSERAATVGGLNGAAAAVVANGGHGRERAAAVGGLGWLPLLSVDSMALLLLPLLGTMGAGVSALPLCTAAVGVECSSSRIRSGGAGGDC